MPRVCTVCAHADRAEIDRRLLAGEAYRNIAEQKNLSVAAVNRHMANHIPAALALAQGAAQAAHGDDLLSQMRELQAKTLSVLAKTEAAGDNSTFLKAVREVRQNVELLAKLTGELQGAQTVNILVAAPEWLALRSVILTALDPHPEARAAVIAALGSAGNVG